MATLFLVHFRRVESSTTRCCLRFSEAWGSSFTLRKMTKLVR